MKFLLKDGVTELELVSNDETELHLETLKARLPQDDLLKLDVPSLSFDKAFQPVAQVAEEMVSSLSAIGSPDEVEINFGAKAGGSGGFFGLAKAQADASVSIKLKWKKSS